jgi:alkylation response protein AidB-like acyl-CoA dehydrogenase
VPVGLSDEHHELRRAVLRWAADHDVAAGTRAALDAPDAHARPSWWPSLRAQGFAGLPVPERFGGQGAGLVEAGVVLEALAEVGASDHLGPTILAAVLLSRALGALARDDPRSAELADLVGGVAAGTFTATVALPGAGHLETEPPPEGAVPSGLHLTGTLRPVLADPDVGVLLAPCTGPGGSVWVVVRTEGPGVRVEPLASLDLVRPVVAVTAYGARGIELAHLDQPTVLTAARALFAAEATGGARWCTETAAAHARSRHQFGRPIGQFQAVKHKVADMLVSTEAATAASWDALAAWDTLGQPGGSGQPDSPTSPAAGTAPAAETAPEGTAPAAETATNGTTHLSAAVAAAVAVDAYRTCAMACLQVLGGLGFTWEHDLHLHLRRALSLSALLDPVTARSEVAEGALAGVRRRVDRSLPAGADAVREVIRPLVATVAAAPPADRRRLLVDLGLLVPHWPPPFGRGASPVEQVVIDQELAAAGIHRPSLAVGAWALPTIIAHGSADQRQRWVRPTLLGSVTWCQLFSEPDAGSDLANLRTRATRVPGGWRLQGQKVWTSLAAQADLGICLARTDPTSTRHEGITYFVVDMRAPGVEVRPLRELTGDALFNEVFLDGVVVPDDHVVGQVGEGWTLARTTLANERVQMSSGATFGAGVEALLAQWRALDAEHDPRPASGTGIGWDRRAVLVDHLGALVAEAGALAALEARSTRHALLGAGNGPESSVRKLLGAEHEQRVQELGLALLGPAGAVAVGDGERWGRGVLVTRCLTIAGGTSEIQRNVIAERLLGLPRDPEPPS